MKDIFIDSIYKKPILHDTLYKYIDMYTIKIHVYRTHTHTYHIHIDIHIQ